MIESIKAFFKSAAEIITDAENDFCVARIMAGTGSLAITYKFAVAVINDNATFLNAFTSYSNAMAVMIGAVIMKDGVERFSRKDKQ